jgi:HEAT repeat protein
VLEQLLQSLDDAGSLPAQRELDTLFDQLPGATLGTVLGWLKQVQNRELRGLMERTAARLASANTAELLRLIGDDDPVLALEAIRRAGELRTPAAVAPLLKVLATRDVELRQAAAQALAEIGSPGAMRALESALDDADRDVRVTAVRAMGARGHRAALPRIEAVVKGKAVRDADRSEKMAFFEAYGTLAGAEGIPLLDELLNGRTALLRLKVDPDIRACAAMALGRIGTPEAEAALRRASDDKDVRVRAAINRVLRGSPS